MKSFISILAVAFLLVGTVSAQDFAKERQLRNPLDLMPRPITHINEDGTIRQFNSPGERDRVLKQQAEERAARQDNLRRYEQQCRAQQERRSNEAGWKLGAIGLGVVVGLVRLLLGRR